MFHAFITLSNFRARLLIRQLLRGRYSDLELYWSKSKTSCHAIAVGNIQLKFMGADPVRKRRTAVLNIFLLQRYSRVCIYLAITKEHKSTQMS